jgi:site-specific recombinase XerD
MNRIECSAEIEMSLEKMVAELRYTNRKENTIATYLGPVKKMLIYFQTEGKKCTSEEVWDYLRFYNGGAKRPQTKKVHSFAIKFYCQKILDWNETICKKIFPRIKGDSILPDILTQDEMNNILKNTYDIFEKSIIYTLYATGIRISELINLKVEDINSQSQTIYIKNGKGGKGRVVPLSQSLLALLRDWWIYANSNNIYIKEKGKQNYLFPSFEGRKSSHLIVSKVWKLIIERVYPEKKLGLHTLRRCFATHALEKGVNIFTLSKWMGHSNLYSTVRYLRLTNILEEQETAKLDQCEISKTINTFCSKTPHTTVA